MELTQVRSKGLCSNRFHESPLSGCLGSLVRNESDMAPLPTDYPYFADYEVVEPQIILWEAKAQLLSGYNGTTGTKTVDILNSSITKQTSEFWIGLLVIILVSCLVLKLRIMVTRKRAKIEGRPPPDNRNPLYDALTFLFNYDTTEFDDLAGKILSFILTIACFLFFVYFSNFMATDLVVPNEPFVIRRLEDIISIKDKMQPSFIEILGDHLEFQNAKKGSIKKKFWDIFADPKRMKARNDSIIMAVKSFDFVFNAILAGIRGERMVIISETFSPLFMSSLCKAKAAFSTAYPMSYPFAATDPRAEYRAKAALIRHEFAMKLAEEGHPFHRGRTIQLRKLVEGNLMEGIFRKLARTAMLSGLSLNPDPYKYADCMRYEQIHMETVTVKEAVPDNLKGLFKCCLWILLFSLIVLMGEYLYTKMVEKK